MTELTVSQKYARFGREVLEAFQECYSDLDGGTLQDIGERCGVLVKHEATVPCGPEEVCRCREYEGIEEENGIERFCNPIDCYRRVRE